MPVLLDMGANVNMITPECVVALGLQMGPLTDLCEVGITIDQPFNYEGRPIGYVIMSVQIDGTSGYNEDHIVLMACSSAKFAHHVPIILGTPTMDRAIATLKESEIDRLATPWACVRKSTLLWAATTWVTAIRADVAMKPIDITGYEEPIHLLTAEVVDRYRVPEFPHSSATFNIISGSHILASPKVLQGAFGNSACPMWCSQPCPMLANRHLTGLTWFPIVLYYIK